MQHQQEPLEALQGRHLAPFQGEAAPFCILVGGLGTGPAAVLADPLGTGRAIGEEDPGLVRRPRPSGWSGSPGAIPLP